MHRTYMGHLERGEKNLSFSTLVRVANALDTPLSDLLTGIESGDPGAVSGPARRGRARNVAHREPDAAQVVQQLAAMEKAIRVLRSTTLLVLKSKPTGKHKS